MAVKKKKENYADNLRKKQEIDKILDDFLGKLSKIKKERDVVISDFLEILKQKHIEELKNNLKF